MSQPLRRNLHRRIVHALGRQILRGEIRPGDAIPAVPALPASRTALREAIKVLEAKGLVEARPRLGTRVRAREAWNLLDPDVLAWRHDSRFRRSLLHRLTEVRAIIEPAAAALAAERATPAALTSLEEAYARMAAALAAPAPDVDGFVAADVDFHRAILRACGNELLEQMSRVINAALLVSFRATSRMPGQALQALPRHQAVLDAIRLADGDRAAAAMRQLVDQTAHIIDSLADGGVEHATTEGEGRDRDGREPRDRTRNRREVRSRGRDRRPSGSRSGGR